MGTRFRSWWQQIKIHPVRTVLMALLTVVIVLLILSILGYIFNWDWTGLNGYKNISTATSSPSKITTTVTYLSGKTLWDWLQLLIIPAVLAVAGYIINLTISRGEQEATKQRAQSEREATDKRAETERNIAEDNQHETALQDYIDDISELLLSHNLRESDEDEEVRKIARVRTWTVLPRLDAERKGRVLQFLQEAGLISKNKCTIDLRGVDLRRVDLSTTMRDLPEGADLVKRVNRIERADLAGALLADANLEVADLAEANLVGAYLGRADLKEAFLVEGTDLREADLSLANLSGANLSGANLSAANLKDVIGVTVEELEKQAYSLQGATMPDGSIHP